MAKTSLNERRGLPGLVIDTSNSYHQGENEECVSKGEVALPKDLPESPISQISGDLLLNIFEYMDVEQLAKFTAVTKDCIERVDEDFAWSQLQSQLRIFLPWTFRPPSSKSVLVRLAKLKTAAKIISETAGQEMDNIKRGKVILVGDRGTGMTSLVRRFIDNEPPQSTQRGSEDEGGQPLKLRLAYLSVNNEAVALRILDRRVDCLASPFTRAFFDGAFVILLVFDLTNKESFLDLPRHLLQLDRQIYTGATSPFGALREGFDIEPNGASILQAASADAGQSVTSIPKVLVGTKADLIEQKQVSFEEATVFARQHHMPYVETSSVSGKSVEIPFVLAVSSIVHR